MSALEQIQQHLLTQLLPGSFAYLTPFPKLYSAPCPKLGIEI